MMDKLLLTHLETDIPPTVPATRDNEFAVQVSIALSLKRITDLLDLVVDHNSFPSTSIAVSTHTTR